MTDRTRHEFELSAQESVFIGPDIEVKITSIRPYLVMIGIQAPREKVIVRDEIYFGPERK